MDLAESSLQATPDLIPALYDDVKRIARRQRQRFSPGNTLCTSALVNEAYLKLVGTPLWNDQQHFLRASALAMRQIITDLARSKGRGKRAARVLSLDDEALQVADSLWADGAEERVLAVAEAVERLAQQSPRLAEVVNCRFFAGYTEDETANALGISERTLRREWAKARAWLYRELEEDAGLSAL